jgi:hypothetical protein
MLIEVWKRFAAEELNHFKEVCHDSGSPKVMKTLA